MVSENCGVVAEIWDNVKTVLPTEILGDLCAGIFVYYYMASNWSNGSGVVFKGDVELLPS